MVVTFDADQTLVDFRAAMASALEAALAELRRHLPAAHALSRHDLQATRDLVAAELGPGARLEEVRAAAFMRTLEELGAGDRELAAAVTRLYLDVRFRELRLYDDVLPTLEALRAHRLGLVSNGNSYPDRVGLASYFDFVVFAHDHGVAKPASGFYEAVLASASCSAEEIVHVGDSIENDVAPVQELGGRAVWLNREGRRGVTSGAWADVDSLAELPALLSA